MIALKSDGPVVSVNGCGKDVKAAVTRQHFWILDDAICTSPLLHAPFLHTAGKAIRKSFK